MLYLRLGIGFTLGIILGRAIVNKNIFDILISLLAIILCIAYDVSFI